ncbi:hypothetical protein [Klebsiella grimontii]|uniref:hypothetical protein n=1 Tax=Klebsiella grimontii TaxID=2058152 RepID=UPI0015B3157D|nr:hypothetical protein [Klebsiella grimontii]
MRNKFPGQCYRCKVWVEKGAGHFERHLGRFRVIHADCVIAQRKEKAEAIASAE